MRDLVTFPAYRYSVYCHQFPDAFEVFEWFVTGPGPDPTFRCFIGSGTAATLTEAEDAARAYIAERTTYERSPS